MRLLLLTILCTTAVLCSNYIANDVVNNYGQVKELLGQFYRRSARRMGNDYNPDVITKKVKELGDDGTEATVNRDIWEEVFENDIILTLPQAERLLGEQTSVRGKRQIQPGAQYYWQNLTISYNFAVYDANWQNQIRSALRHIEQNTCFRFRENGPGPDGLRYFRGSGCWSNVGRVGGMQLVSIGYGCENLGIVAHETLHALGLWHEQSRYDRDDFVRLNTNWIIRGTEGNFEKRSPTNSENSGQPYDLGSVMHYGPKSFTTNWDYDTILTKDPKYQQTIGQREGISFKDARMINMRYCEQVCPRQLSCQNDGYTDPNSCSQCKCPRGFAGTYCERVATNSCGGDLVASSTLQTLMSDRVYANTNCAWRIKSRYGERIEVFADTLSFPCSDSCTSYVEVKTSKVKTATGAHLCCKPPTTSFVSEGDDVIIILRGSSNLPSGYLGFTFRFRSFGSRVIPSNRRVGSPVVTPDPTTSTTTSTTTTTTTTTTTPPTTTTTENRETTAPPPTWPTGEWGNWGEFTRCSKSCGGCGTRQRVRGCYGGNGVCNGYAVQTQYCNQHVCTKTTPSGTCQGRIVLPCDMASKLTFGQKQQTNKCTYSPTRVKGNDSFYRNPVVQRKRINRNKRHIANAASNMCEKRFTYSCPTNLLTINIDWRTAFSDPEQFAPVQQEPVQDACCPGFYQRDGICYKM